MFQTEFLQWSLLICHSHAQPDQTRSIAFDKQSEIRVYQEIFVRNTCLSRFTCHLSVSLVGRLILTVFRTSYYSAVLGTSIPHP
ncbi:hypothetical protein BC833DRAFT_594095 [Globomyces pollinis-pini]|nr:hypothetical protein BC833DRAFT_594095 [Globomyces pollinis-pini]